MPYEWSQDADPDQPARLVLWPHRSLPRRGFAAFVLGAFTMITIPLYPLIGTILLWGLLPFMLVAVFGLWWALERSYRDGDIREDLTIGPEQVHLTHRNPRGEIQEWDCNRYWARIEMHPTEGPVPYYLTLKGSDREVEIGAFLSEDERRALYGEISAALRPVQVS